jgi:hypothetical protein
MTMENMTIKKMITLALVLIALVALSGSSCLKNQFAGNFSTKVVNSKETLSSDQVGAGYFWSMVGLEEVTIGDSTNVSLSFTIVIDTDDDGNPIDPIIQTVIIDDKHFVIIQSDSSNLADETIKQFSMYTPNLLILFEMTVNPDNPNQIKAMPTAFSKAGFLTYHDVGTELGDAVEAEFSGTLQPLPAGSSSETDAPDVTTDGQTGSESMSMQGVSPDSSSQNLVKSMPTKAALKIITTLLAD